MRPTHFQIIPDFDGQSANGARCYFTNLSRQKADPKRPQQQPHEVDEFVLRGPAISFEGFMDIRPAVIIDTAREVFGMWTAESVEDLTYANSLLKETLAAESKRADDAEQRLKDMILANAEMIVQQQALSDELGQAYEDLYDGDVELVSLEELVEEELS